MKKFIDDICAETAALWNNQERSLVLIVYGFGTFLVVLFGNLLYLWITEAFVSFLVVVGIILAFSLIIKGIVKHGERVISRESDSRET